MVSAAVYHLGGRAVRGPDLPHHGQALNRLKSPPRDIPSVQVRGEFNYPVAA